MTTGDPKQSALDALSAANSPAALRQAHADANRSVKALRKGQKQVWGVLAQTFIAAVKSREDQRAAGATEVEIARNFGASIRAAWPKGREEPWHYLCETCDDLGFQFLACSPESHCGRPFRLPGADGNDFTGRGRCAPGHQFVRTCWCEKGKALQRGLMKQPRPDEDFTAAGRSKPTRVGR